MNLNIRDKEMLLFWIGFICQGRGQSPFQGAVRVCDGGHSRARRALHCRAQRLRTEGKYNHRGEGEGV